MPAPFEILGERLLRDGVAPRHVRAYLTELREHLADLIEQECAAGGDAREALRRARAALGDDATLAAAMLARPGVRSLTARAPPVAMILLLVPLSDIGSVLLVRGQGAVLGASAITASANLLIIPAMSALFALMAWRQRLAPAWALAGSTIALLFFLHMEFHLGAPNLGAMPPGLRLFYTPDHHVRVGFNMVPIFHPRTWALMAAQWPLVTAQYLLTLLPATWLWLDRRRAERSAA
jgi:hypothetical protein